MAKKTHKNGDRIKLTAEQKDLLEGAAYRSRVARVAFQEASQMVESATTAMFDRAKELVPELKEYEFSIRHEPVEIVILYKKREGDQT